MDLNLESFKQEYPDIAKAVRDEGRAEGVADGIEKGKAEGAQTAVAAERDRIKAIFALNSPGHEALVQAAMFDGTSTAGDVAMKIVAADKAARGNKLDALRKDGATVGQVQPGAAGLPSTLAEDKSLPVDERCKANWDKDPAVRAEYTTLEAYTAYVKAEESGRIRVVGRKSA